MIAPFAIKTSGYFPWIEIGEFKIQSYFVVVSFVLCLCAAWISTRASAHKLPPKRAIDTFIIAMIGGLIGSRLLHVFWEEPQYYLDSPTRVFDVIRGGFVWYGGFLGATVAIIAFLKWQGERDFLRWFDFFAPLVAIGYAGGRVACVLTGCCFGRVCEWPVGGHQHFFWPSQIFAVVWELSVAVLLLWLEKKQSRLARKWNKRTLPDGGLFSLWLVLHGSGRIIMEAMREDDRGPTLGPITISLVVSLVLVIVGTTFLVRKHVQTRV